MVKREHSGSRYCIIFIVIIRTQIEYRPEKSLIQQKIVSTLITGF